MRQLTRFNVDLFLREPQGLEFQGFKFAVILTPIPHKPLKDILVQNNIFRDIDISVILIGSSNAKCKVRRVAVVGNEFYPMDDSTESIQVVGAAPQTDGETAADSLFDEIIIKENFIQGGFGGIFIIGGMALTGTNVENITIRNVLIESNELIGVYDISIGVTGGYSLGGGTVQGVTVEDVRVLNNNVIVQDSPGSPIWFASGVAFDNSDGLSSNNSVRKLRIANNHVEGTGCLGIYLNAGHNELTEGQTTFNEIVDVVIEENEVIGCLNGVGLYGAVAAASGGNSSNNILHQVSVTNNTLTNNDQGVNIIGGVGIESTAVPGSYDIIPAVVSNNLVENLQISDNQVSNSLVGFQMVGGISSESIDSVTENLVTNVIFDLNELTDNINDCDIQDNIVTGDEGGQATGNSVLVICSEK